MNWRHFLLKNPWRACVGAVLTVALALLMRDSLFGQKLGRLSYDIPFGFGPSYRFDEVIIVTMDESSARELKEQYGRWNRATHARLINHVMQGEPKLIILDFTLADPTSKDADEQLIAAIRRSQRVLLAGVKEPIEEGDSRTLLLGGGVMRPLPEFREVARGVGAAIVDPHPADQVVRWHYRSSDGYRTLAAEAAALTATNVAVESLARPGTQWFNHYGPNRTVISMGYARALTEPPQNFRDKYVIVGGKPLTKRAGEETDQFRTPHAGRGAVSGPELVAIALMNFLRGDWLAEISRGEATAWLLFFGAAFGFGLAWLNPLKALLVATVGALVVAVAAISCVWMRHVWSPWLLVCVAQVPCALTWSMVTRTLALLRENQELKTALSPASGISPSLPVPTPTGSEAPTVHGATGQPAIPDHELLRRVGSGAYGEVWLARNAIGHFHAVKIVYRDRFETADPYEREFRGIQKYMPVSLTHPGLLHLLHVGRNDAQGYFFNIMEPADDSTQGRDIDPATYTPKNLAQELRANTRLPVGECVALALQLSEALDHLHRQKLVHRDIKPANIIYVNGVPKLADIGLVTDLAGGGAKVTQLGTIGYIAPEGPGTAAADVFSLGKVIYEACMGRDRFAFPELPTTLVSQAIDPQLFQLNSIILKACANDPAQRYQTAAEMRAELLMLPAT